MTAKGHSEYSGRYENALDDPEFEYYDEHVFDAMEEYLKQGRKCPSTAFTHDFGAVYNNLMTVVGEAQSGSLDAEDLKLTLGGCRVLNYSIKTFCILLADTKMKIMSLRRVDNAGQIHIFDHVHEYCEQVNERNVYGQRVRPPINRNDYRDGIADAITKLSQCMGEMEDTLDLMPNLAGAWDYAAATDVNWHPGRVE